MPNQPPSGGDLVDLAVAAAERINSAGCFDLDGICEDKGVPLLSGSQYEAVANEARRIAALQRATKDA